MLGLGVALGFLASVTLLTSALNATAAESSEKEDRAADRAAVLKARRAFGEAFQKGDARGAASVLTSGAELIRDDAPPIRGRDTIEKALAEHFARNPRVKIAVEEEAVRFTSRDSAVEEGLMKVTPESGEPSSNRYSLLYVREDGKWLLAIIREWPDEQESLSDLDWLIGKWRAQRKDAEIDTVYEWFGNKAFIRATFTIREQDKTFRGMQLIGVDPQTGDLRTWTFENDGGVGEGNCTRDGRRWVFESTTTLADGSVLTAQNILVKINADSFTWQPVNLTVNDETIKDLPPVKVTRVKDKN